MLDFLIETAREAGDHLMRYFGKVASAEIEQKGPRDLVSHVDRSTEDLVVGRILERFPDDGIVAEEHSSRPGSSGDRWYLDPLDGTTNFLHRIPYFGVSLGYQRQGRMEAGVVLAPALGTLWAAERGKGATANGTPIRCSDQRALDAALLATGFADSRTHERVRLTRLEQVVNAAGGIRRMGAAALDLCMVGEGVLDGFWEWNLSSWDVAAGSLIVTEAGGRVSDGKGGDDWLEGRAVVATNGHLHPALLGLVSGPRPEPRLAELQAEMAAFARSRGFERWHQPKNLAMALSVEAAELLELFQWLSPEESAPEALPEETSRAAADELADVLAYSMSLANRLGIDLAEAWRQKMERNAVKYPADAPRPEAWGRGR